MTKVKTKRKHPPEPPPLTPIEQWRSRSPRLNPLKEWFSVYPRPMLQKEFAEKAGISQSFLTSLLSDQPPWPARQTMRKITEITEGAVTADMWVEMEDPPPRIDRAA